MMTTSSAFKSQPTQSDYIMDSLRIQPEAPKKPIFTDEEKKEILGTAIKDFSAKKITAEQLETIKKTLE